MYFKKVIRFVLIALLALVIAFNYACVDGECTYSSCYLGVWHGINFPSNYILSLFSERFLLGESDSASYRWGALITAILSTWGWVCFLMYSLSYQKHIFTR